jgi:hypothetical protein
MTHVKSIEHRARIVETLQSLMAEVRELKLDGAAERDPVKKAVLLGQAMGIAFAVRCVLQTSRRWR